jgi:hypothetical protein
MECARDRGGIAQPWSATHDAENIFSTDELSDDRIRQTLNATKLQSYPENSRGIDAVACSRHCAV